jgi:NAD-dependent SIR2 family protein deacetylase
MQCAHNALEDCDLLLVIGTSAVVQVLQFVLNYFLCLSGS